MSDPESIARSTAQELFEDYSKRRDAGEALDFDTFCRSHPPLERELRELDATARLLDRLLPGPLERTAPRGTADEVGRSEVIDERTVDTPSELLERLRGPRSEGDRYSVLGEIGRGGMGVVLSVWDSALRRRLAMKVARDKDSASERTKAYDSKHLGRFLDEAQITSQLDHPGIVPVHEIGIAPDGGVYFTMRLVRGESLRAIFERVHGGHADWNQVRAVSVLLKVCEAMSYAHSKGVLHRDLKPANVMVGRFGEVYVMDWGLARVIGRRDAHDVRLRSADREPPSTIDTERRERRDADPLSPLITMDGDVIGTASYMSPEQARGELDTIGPHSDVYAVGAMLYHLISGEIPYLLRDARLSSRTVLARVLDGPPRALHAFGHKTPAALVAICEMAMARDVDSRYGSMDELAVDLRAYLEGRTVGAYRTGAWAEASTWVRRNRALAVSLAAVVLSLGIALVIVLRQSERARQVETVVRLRNELDHLRAFGNDEMAFAVPNAETVAKDWLERARKLVQHLEEQSNRLDRLRARLQVSPEEVEQAAAEHPRASELRILDEEVRWRERVSSQRWPRPADRSIASDFPPAILSDLDYEALQESNRLVFRRVRPDEPRIYGQEPEALDHAQLLVEISSQSPFWHPTFQDTLAFALFRMGRFDEAVAEQTKAQKDPTPVEQPDLWRETFQRNLDLLERERDAWLDGSEERYRAEIAARAAAIEREVSDSLASNRVHEDAALLLPLARLVQDLAALKQRLMRAEEAIQNPIWQEAIASIAGNPRYGGLRIVPQLDLLPLWEDPHSRLWEFAHLPSGEPARRAADGRIAWRRETGLVFVLLPGKRKDDAGVSPTEESESFFISKFEMTCHQWWRMGGNRRPWTERIGWPVDWVSWEECRELLRSAGGWLRLPSRDEWEYAARGGTHTGFWTGDDPNDLLEFENVTGLRFGTLPVGHLAANPFGLHDVHGNVREWTSDPVEGASEALGGYYTMGGSPAGPPVAFGTTGRTDLMADKERDSALGLRPARSLTR